MLSPKTKSANMRIILDLTYLHVSRDISVPSYLLCALGGKSVVNPYKRGDRSAQTYRHRIFE